MNFEISIISVFLGLAFAGQFVHIIWAWVKGPKAQENPWEARTPEWFTSSPPPRNNFPVQPEIVSEKRANGPTSCCSSEPNRPYMARRSRLTETPVFMGLRVGGALRDRSLIEPDLWFSRIRLADDSCPLLGAKKLRLDLAAHYSQRGQAHIGQAGIGPFGIEGGAPIPAFSHKGATSLANPGIKPVVVPMVANGEVLSPPPNNGRKVVNHPL